MLGTTYYSELQFQPVRGGEHDWHVWCASGALQVLNTGEHETKLTQDPQWVFSINFANNAAARITPEHPLWRRLAAIAQKFTVEVYQMGWEGPWTPWTGDDASPRRFDCIRIKTKK